MCKIIKMETKRLILRIVMITFTFLPVAQALGQTVSKSTMYPPMGKLVDAGGHLLHINIIGKGGPAVIMESGSGDFSFIWSLVQPNIAKFTTAVTYDRAGFAWSEPGPNPRTGRQLAYELHTALKNAGLKSPYILVGQSFGGFLVRNYARYYPNEVAGMVLVDVLNEDEKIVIDNKPVRIREMAKGQVAPPVKNFINKDTLKIFPDKRDSLYSIIEPPLDKLPDSIQKRQIWAQSQPGFRIAVMNEMNWSPEDVADIYANKGKPQYMLGNIPLYILSKGKGSYRGLPDSAQLETERLKLQEDLAHLSSNSKHIIDKNSGHNIHLEDPALVVEAIRQVFEAVIDHKQLK
jgi:pimeloyl-ACP methyl ester carboxylesterase